MPTFHVSFSIDGLLRHNSKKLGEIFEMDGAEVLAELKARKKKGHEFIPTENCKNFNPKTGCECNKDYKLKPPKNNET